jgi:hypothetical protein
MASSVYCQQGRLQLARGPQILRPPGPRGKGLKGAANPLEFFLTSFDSARHSKNHNGYCGDLTMRSIEAMEFVRFLGPRALRPPFEEIQFWVAILTIWEFAVCLISGIDWHKKRKLGACRPFCPFGPPLKQGAKQFPTPLATCRASGCV